MLRRGAWDELELADEPSALILAHPGWTNDRSTLALAVRETGWFPTSRTSFEASEAAVVKWGWIGVTEDRTVVICNSEGLVDQTGEIVNEVTQVTLARIGNDAGDCLQ
jgi:hypothetical protein